MAEHEIIKHAKKVVKTSKDPKKNWKAKAGEILLDIGIIVFAVTLSLYLHERAEKKSERHIEEDFLTGLKLDLQNDIVELSSDSSMYVKVKNGFNYFLKMGITGEEPAGDSAKFYLHTLYNTTDLVPNNSRFEGMKSSGNLYLIEDKELLNDILDLYQEKIPMLLKSTNTFTDFKVNKISTFLENNLVYGKDRVAQLKPILAQSLFQNYLAREGTINEIINRYHAVLTQCRMIVNKISKTD